MPGFGGKSYTKILISLYFCNIHRFAKYFLVIAHRDPLRSGDMYRRMVTFGVTLVLLPVFLQAQQINPAALGEAAQSASAAAPPSPHGGVVPVAPEARYFRLICLVHLTGSGKHNDPIRPEFVPATAAARDGILSWSVQMTDDKNMAIVHLVAADHKAFDAILNDKRPELRVFEIGKHGKDVIEAELKKYRKDFDLTQFEVVAR
jgi:hypothetical protein